jgi:hypothetical protein
LRKGLSRMPPRTRSAALKQLVEQRQAQPAVVIEAVKSLCGVGCDGGAARAAEDRRRSAARRALSGGSHDGLRRAAPDGSR